MNRIVTSENLSEMTETELDNKMHKIVEQWKELLPKQRRLALIFMSCLNEQEKREPIGLDDKDYNCGSPNCCGVPSITSVGKHAIDHGETFSD